MRLRLPVGNLGSGDVEGFSEGFGVGGRQCNKAGDVDVPQPAGVNGPDAVDFGQVVFNGRCRVGDDRGLVGALHRRGLVRCTFGQRRYRPLFLNEVVTDLRNDGE